MHKKFAYHKPTPGGLDIINELREGYSRLNAAIETLCQPSRERAVALTELETSAMWAIKAVVANDPGSVVDPS